MMLWRKGARTWKAKGYSHTTAADAFEEKFGTERGLGRSRIAVLVTTKKEEIPPDVAAYILDGLPILNPQKWADHLLETANEPPDTPSAAPEAVPEPPRLDMDALATGVAAKLPRLDVDALAAGVAAKLPRLDVDALAEGVAFRLPSPDVDTLAEGVASRLPSPDVDALAEGVASRLPKPPDAGALAEGVAARLPRVDSDELAAKVASKLAPWLGGNAMVMAAGMACFAFLHCHHDAQATASGASSWGEFGHGLDTAYSSQMGEKVPPEHYVPKDPWIEQKHEPCDAGFGETAINGGCWVGISDKKPPCGRLYRNGDTCYRPVAADPKKPVSDEAH